MELIDLIIIGIIVAGALLVIIKHIITPFKKNSNPCQSCPYINGCSKK